MGGFDAYYLAAIWFYDKPLDAAAIKSTLVAAVTAMPALAGRRTSDGIILSNEGARLTVREGHPGSARDWCGADKHVEMPGVRDFADTPSSCSGGEQPLFTVRVTNFADGTSALGIASPHSLMDGKSYYKVVSAIAAAHEKKGNLDKAALLDFDAATIWEEKTKSLDVSKEPTLWVPFRLLEMLEPVWALAMPRLDQILPRAKVHLSLAELTELKAAAGNALAKGGGSKKGCTTNEALSAAFFVALADEKTGPFAADQPGIVRMVVNVQGRGRFAGVDNVAGNFSWMEWMRTPKPPAAMATMAEATQFFVELGAKWRNDASASTCIEEFAIFFRMQDLTGYLWGKTDSVDNTLFVNNQSSEIPLAKLTFGAGPAIGFQPWHSHQHVQIVAAPEPPGAKQRLAGGVDVYLPKDYSPRLGTPEFKQKLLFGWRA